MIILCKPAIDDDLPLSGGVEPFCIVDFAAQSSVEVFVVAVLPCTVLRSQPDDRAVLVIKPFACLVSSRELQVFFAFSEQSGSGQARVVRLVLSLSFDGFITALSNERSRTSLQVDGDADEPQQIADLIASVTRSVSASAWGP